MKKLVFIALFLSVILSQAQNSYQTAPLINFDEYGSCGNLILQPLDLNPASASAYDAPGCMDLNAAEANDLWYKMRVPEGISELSFHVYNSDIIPMPISQAPSEIGLAVYDGNDSNELILNECFNSVFEDEFSNGEIRWATLSGLTAGDTLYMRVWDQNNAAQKLFLAVSERMEFPENYCETPASADAAVCNILSEPTDFTAPVECAYNVTDNPAFYHFTVTESSQQPVNIVLSNIIEYSFINEVSVNLQFALYSWNGEDCTNLGGGPMSDPPNTSGTYMGCASGSEEVVFTQNLDPGQYVFVIDGFSGLEGKSMFVADFNIVTTSVADFYGSTTNVYPNPAHEKFTIRFDDKNLNQAYHVEIYTAQGKCIIQQTIQKSACISTKNWEAGIYMIKMTCNGQTFTEKLVVY
jgi:hypothetical protein